MFTLNLDGSPTSEQPEPDDACRVQLEDDATASGYSPACINCGNPITDEGAPAGWVHEDTERSECNPDDDDDDEATPPPLHWCNSASISLDTEGDAVHVSISVGDPRGAFVMTVRRLSDGSLVMHLPHPGESLPHMTTEELHPGTLKVL